MTSSVLLISLLLFALGVLSSAEHGSNDADASGSGSGDADMSRYAGCLATGTQRGKRSHGEEGGGGGRGGGRGRARQEVFSFPANGMSMARREDCCQLGVSLPDFPRGMRGIDAAMREWKTKAMAGLKKRPGMLRREKLECMERAFCCCSYEGKRTGNRKRKCGSLESVFDGGRQ